MKKLFAAILILFTGLRPAPAEKLGDLPDVNQPASIKVDGDTVYICDRDRIHIIGLDPFSSIRAFGSAGEGPGEFNSVPHLSVGDSDLFINSMGKFMRFSKEGEFLEQTKLNFRLWYFYHPIMRTADGYVAFPTIRSEEDDAFLFFGKIYDSSLSELVSFYKGVSPRLLPPARPGSKIVKAPFQVIPDCFETAADHDSVFVADTRRGFYIAVFDSLGKIRYEINREEPRIPVPAGFKAEYMKELRESDRWEELKARFDYKFKSHYPAFFSFKLKGDRLYVTTYAKKDAFFELVEMDRRGEILERSCCFPMGPEERPLSGLEGFSNQYDVQGDSLYYLRFNDESSTWELHRTGIR